MYHLIINKKQCDIKKILDSGQVFRYEKTHHTYILIYNRHVVEVQEVDDGYLFDCNEREFQQVWHPYLDLERDYDTMNAYLLEKDPSLATIIHEQQGIRILRQAPFEMLMTFIISQSKSMIQIRRLVNALSLEFGTPINHSSGNTYYAFPTPEQLMDIEEAEYREMRYGYRAPYLEAAVRASLEEPFNKDGTYVGDAQDLVRTLMSIKGVGIKVASCVALFGYGRMDVFPVDTWIRKMMTMRYGATIEATYGKVNDITISRYAHDVYGQYAGIAQQYIFEAREEYFQRKNVD